MVIKFPDLSDSRLENGTFFRAELVGYWRLLDVHKGIRGRLRFLAVDLYCSKTEGMRHGG